MAPDLVKDDPLNPKEVLVLMKNRWPWMIQPHYVVDAAFHSASTLNNFSAGPMLTASCNRHHKQWLFDLLDRNCTHDSWLAIYDANYVWSIQRTREATHFLVTNAFSPADTIDPPRVVVGPQVRAEMNSSLREGLKKRAKTLGLPDNGNKDQLIDSVSKALSIDPSAYPTVEDGLKCASVKSSPPHHQWYRSHFNAIDLHDRYWYQLQHKVNKSCPK